MFYLFLVNKPAEKNRLDLEKVKEVVNVWNRYELKDVPNNENNVSNIEQKELRAFEILEERANNSNLNASSPTVCQLLERGQSSKISKNLQTSRSARSLNFDVINASTPRHSVYDSEDSYSNSSQECDPLDLTEGVKNNTNVNNNEEKDNFLKSDQNHLTENEKKYLENYTKKSEILNHINFNQSFDTEILSKRLEELELEIEKFRAENSKLIKLQREFEIERQRFFKGKDDFMKKLNEEKKKDEEKLAEERKKFMKEKATFERNVRELRNKPNRQEREEIKQLRQQV